MSETIHCAKATFTIDAWEDAPLAVFPETAGLTQATVRKTFSGDLEGSSTALLLMAQNATSRAYVAQEYITGSLHGKHGSFVLQHSARDEGEQPQGQWHIVAGSGTGELAGLRGSGTYQHDEDGARLTLDYTLG